MRHVCFALCASLLPLVAAAQTAGYDKGFFIRSEDRAFSLTTNARIELRGTYEATDDGTDDLDHHGAFSVPRARLKLSGNLFGPDLTWVMQIEFGGGAYAWLRADYGVLPGVFHVRAGQFKRPFSRQQITSSGKLELVDRARTDRDFGAGRDIGLALCNNYEASPTFEWALALFNGVSDRPVFEGTAGANDAVTGRFTNVPTSFHPMVVARVGYNYGGIKGYSEADLEGGPFRAAVGLSGMLDFDVENEKASAVLGQLDAIIKVSGFSASAGFYVASSQDGEGFADQSFARFGLHAQLGHVFAQRVLPVVRVAMLMPDGDDNDVIEAQAGLSFYFSGHNAKLQLDGGIASRETTGDRALDGLFRVQLETGF